MKIQAEIFNGANVKRKNNDYYECFKNPTSKEWNNVLQVGKEVRGMLLDNGDLYIWTSEILHVEAIDLFNIPDGIHLIAHSRNNIDIELTKEINYEYLYSAFTKTMSLYNYINKNCVISDIDTYFYGAKKDKRYENIKSINDLIEQYKEPVIAFKKQAEIFEGANYNGDYFECFKNPTSKEWDSVVKIDKVRGIILDNGDLYIWPSDISHDDATILFGVPDGIHIQVYSQESLGIFLIPGIDLEYMYRAFTNTTSLYNYVNNNFRILELNTDYYHAEHDNRYYRIKTFDDITTQYNKELVPAMASKIKRLIKAEILSGANYKGGYFECFKNPTSKEWNEVSKASDNTRGILLNNGDLYIWSSEILHSTAINLFGIPDGIHIQTYNNYALSFHLIPETDLDYIYNAFKNTTSLYNYIDRDFDIVFIDTDTYGAKEDSRYENIKSMSDLEKQYNKEPITSKIKRLIKK